MCSRGETACHKPTLSACCHTCDGEFVTHGVKWWLPLDNKQRDLLSMTEHSCTWFYSVTVLALNYLSLLTVFLCTSSACRSLLGIGRLTPPGMVLVGFLQAASCVTKSLAPFQARVPENQSFYLNASLISIKIRGYGTFIELYQYQQKWTCHDKLIQINKCQCSELKYCLEFVHVYLMSCFRCLCSCTDVTFMGYERNYKALVKI